MNSHVRWTMSRPGPHKKTLINRDLYGFFKNEKKLLRTYVKLQGKATLHMLFPRADLGVGTGGSGPPFCPRIFFCKRVSDNTSSFVT